MALQMGFVALAAAHLAYGLTMPLASSFAALVAAHLSYGQPTGLSA
jgi:hypothetical protein